MKKRLTAMLLVVCMLFTFVPNVGATNDSDLTPDELYYTFDGRETNESNADITLSKTAVSNGDGTFDITLSAEAKETVQTKQIEVVFVLDASGSMCTCADPDHKDQHGRYGNNCERTGSSFSSPKSRWSIANDAIDTMQENLGTTGVTYHYVAFGNKGAAKEYTSYSKVSLSRNSYTYLSEGVATGVSAFDDDNATQVLIIVSDGLSTDGYDGAQSALAKFDGTVYTVGFTFTVKEFNDLASRGCAYTAEDADDLSVAMEEITENIVGLISDPMGSQVELTGDVSVTDGYNQTVTGNKSIINWTDENGLRDEVTLEYTVEIKEGEKKAGANQNVKLNGNAVLNYSYREQSHSVAFPVPEIWFDAATLDVEYKFDGRTVKSEDQEWIILPGSFETEIPSVGETVTINGTDYYVSEVKNPLPDTLEAEAYKVEVVLSETCPMNGISAADAVNGIVKGYADSVDADTLALLGDDFSFELTTVTDIGADVEIDLEAEDVPLTGKNLTISNEADAQTILTPGIYEVSEVLSADAEKKWDAPDSIYIFVHTDGTFSYSYDSDSDPGTDSDPDNDFADNTIVNSPKTYTVTFITKDADQGTLSGTTSGSYLYGEAHPSAPTTNPAEHFALEGWYDEDGVKIADFPAVVDENVTYEAHWKQVSTDPTPIEPKVAVYRVEHYKEQLDGTYVLADTEFPLYGEIGATVTATAKTYEHYTENTAHADRVSSGEVIMPTLPEGATEPVILTLKLYYKLDQFTVTFTNGDGNGTVGGTTSVSNSYKYGAAFPTTPATAANEHYAFDGWYLGDTKVTSFPATVTESVTYVAHWKQVSTDPTPIEPKVAAYKVEHYKEQLGGTYVLADTEFPLYGEINATVTATAKTYEHYTENTAHADRVPSGEVIMPTLPEGATEPVILTLKLYYKLDQFTVTFTNGDGNGTVGGTTSVSNSYKYGAAFPTTPATAANEHYAFDGWYLGDTKVTSFPATVTESVTYVAHWKQVSTDPTPIEPKVAAYKVEHYKEQLDGTYVLADTEFPLYGALGKIVKAVAKDYDGYTVDLQAEGTVASGEVIKPELNPDGTGVKILVLKLYYAVDNWNENNNQETGGDDIPDKYQVLVKYTSERGGEITGLEKEVITLKDANGKYLTQDDVEASGSEVERTSSKYRFDEWTGDWTNKSLGDDEELEPFTIKDAKGGETYIVTAEFNKKSSGDKEIIEEPEVPQGLNGDDHFQYIFGYDDGTVRPLAKITRAEVAAIFYRLLDDETREHYFTTENDFPDMKDTMWYNKAVSTLANAGIITGCSDGLFHGGRNITRAELATIIAKFDNITYRGEDLFSDISGHWARAYINSSADKGWIVGDGTGKFRPYDDITRAEVMTMINAVLNRAVDEDGLCDGYKKWPDNTKGTWYYYQVIEATNYHDYEREADMTETWLEILPDKIWDEAGR